MRVRMWAALGLALAVFMALFALLRSRRQSANYYESDVYGMTPLLHRRYALAALLFALVFLAALFFAQIPAVPLLGAFAVICIFYFSSFLRGFSDEE